LKSPHERRATDRDRCFVSRYFVKDLRIGGRNSNGAYVCVEEGYRKGIGIYGECTTAA
jgi:hypothetical protein